MKMGDPRLDLGFGDFVAQGCKFVDFDLFDVTAEGGALLCEIRVDIEHAAVVVAHDSEAVGFEDTGYFSGFDPALDFFPRDGIVLKNASDFDKGNTGAAKHVGDFRNGASLTIGQPFAGHRFAIWQGIEGAGNPWRVSAQGSERSRELSRGAIPEEQWQTRRRW